MQKYRIKKTTTAFQCTVYLKSILIDLHVMLTKASLSGASFSPLLGRHVYHPVSFLCALVITKRPSVTEFPVNTTIAQESLFKKKTSATVTSQTSQHRIGRRRVTFLRYANEIETWRRDMVGFRRNLISLSSRCDGFKSETQCSHPHETRVLRVFRF